VLLVDGELHPQGAAALWSVNGELCIVVPCSRHGMLMVEADKVCPAFGWNTRKKVVALRQLVPGPIRTRRQDPPPSDPAVAAYFERALRKKGDPPSETQHER
jgi:hypothetical protein